MVLSLALARVGACLCGVNVALHRDARNRSVNCEEARRRHEALKARRAPAQRSLERRDNLHLAGNVSRQGGVR